MHEINNGGGQGSGHAGWELQFMLDQESVGLQNIKTTAEERGDMELSVIDWDTIEQIP